MRRTVCNVASSLILWCLHMSQISAFLPHRAPAAVSISPLSPQARDRDDLRFPSKRGPISWTTKTRRRDENTALQGIPKLFRWLVDLYPIVSQSVGEGLQMSVDNFYLDMNGIIHTCTHSNNDKLISLNERDMFQRIFAYTDRLYKLVR